MSAITWADLAHSLARHLEVMPTDTYFLLSVDDSGRPEHDDDIDGDAWYVQFCAFGESMVRCEVVGNRYLADDRKHSVDDLIDLRADGWNLPADEHINGSPNIFVDLPTDEADRAAAMVTRVFTRTWRVESPAGVRTEAQYLRGRHAFRVLDAPVDVPSTEPLA